MARALVVACGCRGRELARRLAGAGWRVRGTSRRAAAMAAIAAAGAEPVRADPARPGTVLDHVADVAVVYWLLGSAAGDAEAVAAAHGAGLERLLEKLVDTPVRGFVYEAEGSAPAAARARGERLARLACERWRIPLEVVRAPPEPWDAWADAMAAAGARLTGVG